MIWEEIPVARQEEPRTSLHPCIVAVFMHTLGFLADLCLSSVHSVPLCLCLKRTLLILYTCPCYFCANDPVVDVHFGAVLLVSCVWFILGLNRSADFTIQQKSCIALTRNIWQPHSRLDHPRLNRCPELFRSSWVPPIHSQSSCSRCSCCTSQKLVKMRGEGLRQ